MTPQEDQPKTIKVYNAEKKTYESVQKIHKSDDEWSSLLNADEFHVARQKGTEAAFTGRYWDNKEQGVYKCVCCDLDLFDSKDKFDSGTGWPSFVKPVAQENMAYEQDNALFMRRVEVLCPRCQAHLGHVFDDGPEPTHKRYCINSVSLKFDEEKY